MSDGGRVRHPALEKAARGLHPMQQRNIADYEGKDHFAARKDFRMTDSDRRDVERILETAQKFVPYKKSR
jgi:hypothetical protein